MNSVASAAICLALSLVLTVWNRRLPAERMRYLDRVETGAGGDGGMLAVIDSVKAYVRSGGALSEAFAGQMGRQGISSTPAVPDVDQLHGMLSRRCKSDETEGQVSQVAAELDVACRLSDTLGCEASTCLDAVADSYRRMRTLDDLVGNAFATPKATVRLLTALPIVTVLASQLLGANSLSFLFGSGAGRLCLVLGGFIYAMGLMWMKILMENVGEKIAGS